MLNYDFHCYSATKCLSVIIVIILYSCAARLSERSVIV